MPFFWPLPLSPSFFVSHLIVVLTVHLLLALLLGGRRSNRLWTATAFVLPAALALWPGAHAAGGAVGVAGLFAGAALVAAAGAFVLAGRGAPLFSSAAGGAIGGELVRFQLDGTGAHESETTAVARLAIACALGVAVVLLAGRLPAAVALPRRLASLAIAAGACLVGLVLGRVEITNTPPAPPAELAGADLELPPVVVVVLDTVRADHLRLYGYERDTMPKLERFAREKAVVATRATANSPTSLPTHASLFTGLYPPRHGAHYPFATDPNPPPYAYPLAKGIPTLAGILRRQGYWSVGVVANAGALSPAFGLHRGFSHYHVDLDPTFTSKTRTPWRAASERTEPLAALDGVAPFARSEFFEYGVPYRRAAAITDEAISLLDAAGARPLFLFVNYFDAHRYYNPPQQWRDRFPGRRSPWDRRGLSGAVVRRVTRGDRDLTEAERNHLVALYDAELAYLDSELMRLLECLERHPRWEEMLLVITSDHGEAFGEHRFVYHGVNLYEELVGVPLIIKPGEGAPGAPPPGSTLSRPIQSVDVFPTVLEYVGLEIPAGIDGVAWGREREYSRSWVYVKQESAHWRPERLARNLRAVERDGWKLIESSTGRLELYDLARDPGETDDVAREQPGRRDALLAVLGSPGSASPPPDAHSATVTPDTIERLRALGYAP